MQREDRIDANGSGKGMGIGKLGDLQNRIKKKYQWTFRVERNCQDASHRTIDENYVKIAARPSITTDEIELNFLNDKIFIPGKSTWETISVTYYDMASTGLEALYDWIASVFEFNNVQRRQGTTLYDYTGEAYLREYDGGGSNVAIWKLGRVWPTQVNFGELAYDTSEEMNIELTLRYTNVEYRSFCPNVQPAGCFSRC